MRRPLRRLTILLVLLTMMGTGWVAYGEDAARHGAGVALAATREQRQEAELLPVGGALWVYQRSVAPLLAVRRGQ